MARIRQDLELDEKFFFLPLTNTREPEVGWLINMHTVCSYCRQQGWWCSDRPEGDVKLMRARSHPLADDAH